MSKEFNYKYTPKYLYTVGQGNRYNVKEILNIDNEGIGKVATENVTSEDVDSETASDDTDTCPTGTRVKKFTMTLSREE